VTIVESASFTVKNVRGTVQIALAEQREPAEAATITLRSLGGGPALHTTTTDETGAFSFNAIADGWYQLETCREGLNSTVAPVRVTSRATRETISVLVHLAN